MRAAIYGFGQRGKVWAKHLLEAGYSLDICDTGVDWLPDRPRYDSHDLYVVATTNETHIDIIRSLPNIPEVIVEKPVVIKKEDLQYLGNQTPAYCQRFHPLTKLMKSLCLHPDAIQIVDNSNLGFYLDVAPHGLDIIEYVFKNTELPVKSDYYGFAVMSNFQITQTEYERKIFIRSHGKELIFDYRKSQFYVNSKLEMFFENTYTVRELIQNYRQVKENWSNGPTYRSIELHEKYQR